MWLISKKFVLVVFRSVIADLEFQVIVIPRSNHYIVRTTLIPKIVRAGGSGPKEGENSARLYLVVKITIVDYYPLYIHKITIVINTNIYNYLDT